MYLRSREPRQLKLRAVKLTERRQCTRESLGVVQIVNEEVMRTDGIESIKPSVTEEIEIHHDAWPEKGMVAEEVVVIMEEDRGEQ